MNPHALQSVTPLSLIKSFWDNRTLISQMAWREVVGRYKGSIMGLLWSFINPFLMLLVYTFLFSVIFKAKWGIDRSESRTEFAIILFVGLIIHTLLAEVLNQAPGLILSNVNYVKKVIFPLEILPVVSLGSALFHCFVNVIVLLLVIFISNGHLYWTVLLTPLILFPFLFIILGFTWILASLGVYLRDVGQAIGIITTVMLFVSPVFFPISAVPQKYQPFIMLNPLTFIIEQTRCVLIWGHLPNWNGLMIYAVISAATAWFGFAWFQKTRKGFADVL